MGILGHSRTEDFMRTEKEKEMERIKEATGATIRTEDFAYETVFYASDFGA